MKSLVRIKSFLTNSNYRIYILNKIGITKCLSDKIYLKMVFKVRTGKKLDLKNPQTFNEKLQWLKLYNRNPEYTYMVDKIKAKKYVSDVIGDKYIVPTIAIWNSFDEIDLTNLPKKFVIKCNHNSGSGMIICKDKSKLDIKEHKKQFQKALSENYYYSCREWPYKNVKPLIFAEKFLEDEKAVQLGLDSLPVYKIFTFGGEPKIIQTIQNDKKPNETIDYFDTKWNLLNLKQNFPNSKNPYSRPECLNEMLDIARKLSKNIPHVRVDLYQVNGQVYFSEFTFFSDAGFANFIPNDWDKKLGDYITVI